jgi:hypothetical protein
MRGKMSGDAWAWEVRRSAAKSIEKNIASFLLDGMIETEADLEDETEMKKRNDVRVVRRGCYMNTSSSLALREKPAKAQHHAVLDRNIPYVAPRSLRHPISSFSHLIPSTHSPVLVQPARNHH